MLKVSHKIVTPNWLCQHLDATNLVVLDGTIPKVTSEKQINPEGKKIIKGARFFDIKKVFSDVNGEFPNTVLSASEFQEKAQQLGINQDSCIVVYDDLGIYSSARVWWLFQLMGFENVAVLDGGLPLWIANKYPIEKLIERKQRIGDFKANYQPQKVFFKDDIHKAIKEDNRLIFDARNSGRFYGTAPEPREGVRSGRIPNSKSLPYASVLEENVYKSKEALQEIFSEQNPENKEMIFSCGTGITACVLALGAEIAGYKNTIVYDGSWTEWGSGIINPIEK